MKICSFQPSKAIVILGSLAAQTLVLVQFESAGKARPNRSGRLCRFFLEDILRRGFAASVSEFLCMVSEELAWKTRSKIPSRWPFYQRCNWRMGFTLEESLKVGLLAFH